LEAGRGEIDSGVPAEPHRKEERESRERERGRDARGWMDGWLVGVSGGGRRHGDSLSEKEGSPQLRPSNMDGEKK